MTQKIALVTGGSRGLGKSAALHLAKSGMNVIITYVNQKDHAAQVVADIQAMGSKSIALPLDISQSHSFLDFSKQVQSIASDWGATGITVLVNNGGMGIHASIEETTESQFDALYSVHLKGVFFLTQALLPSILDNGVILNVSSGLARFSMPGYSAYAMMKGGIEVFTRFLAKELAPRRIRVNTVAPGAIETDFGGGAVRDNEQINQMIAGSTPLGRVGLPDDIGGAIAALASDHCGWINAQRIEVSGGIFC